MNSDVILISAPNKNIDYPGLSIPILTASLRNHGYTVEQLDLNVVLRDQLLTEMGLIDLVEKTLPYLASISSDNELNLNKLFEILEFLRHIRTNRGFAYIEEIKLRAQSREYQWLFKEEERFLAYMELFKINRSLHYIIDLALGSLDEYQDTYVLRKIQEIFVNIQSTIDLKKPKLVGFSIVDIQRWFSLKLIRKLRPNFNGIIAVGGPDPTRFPKEYIGYCKEIDVVFYREAEESLPQLMKALEVPTPSFSNISGIFYRNSEDSIIENKNMPTNLSSTPTPDFRGLPLNLYLTPGLPIQASRGCYWQKCRFCIHWDTYSNFETRDPKKIIKDIITLQTQYNTKYFHFTDDCIPIPIAKALIDEILKNDLNIRWLAYFRFEKNLSKDLLQQIFKAGGRVLELGLESASPRVLRLMEKNIYMQDVERIVKDAASVGLLLKLFMFHGFPGENTEDLNKTIKFTEEHITNGLIRAFMPLRNRFEFLSGSQIYDSAIADKEDMIARVWEPSGLFGIRAEYVLTYDERLARESVSGFVNRIRDFMKENKIYNTDDENLMLDLLVLDHLPLPIPWSCTYEKSKQNK